MTTGWHYWAGCILPHLKKEEIRNDLQRMISFVDKLNELEPEGLEPVLHMSDANQ